MKQCRKYLACLLVLVLMLSLLLAAAFAAGTDDWTILVYICGADLESDNGFATDNLIGMTTPDLPNGVNIVVETGGANGWQNDVVKSGQIGRYLVENKALTVLDILPDADMGDPETLESFVAWGLENYPATHTGLVLWDHGSGSINGVCFDQAHGSNSLSLKNIDEALTAAGNQRFEFIGFDACLMDTLETAAMCANHANFMYASQETEPGCGWDYASLCGYLAENPTADGDELGIALCDAYFEYAGGLENDSDVTFAILDLNRLQDFADAFDRTAKELVDAEYYREAAMSGRRADNFGGNNRSVGYNNMVDVYDFLNGVTDYAPSAAQAMQALDNMVVYKLNGMQHDNAGGLSMYFPLSVSGTHELSVFAEYCPSNYYRELVGQLAGRGYGAEHQSTGGILGELGDTACPIDVADVTVDGGNLVISLNDTSALYMAECWLTSVRTMDDGSTVKIYYGSDDDLVTSEDGKTISDNFYGYWLCMNDTVLPVCVIDHYGTCTEYSCPILLNGEPTNLMIVYDSSDRCYHVEGTWNGIDADTGMAGRHGNELKIGDEIQLCYDYTDDSGSTDVFYGDPITVDENLSISYEHLKAGQYDYSISLTDVFGDTWSTNDIHYTLREDGSIGYSVPTFSTLVEVPLTIVNVTDFTVKTCNIAACDARVWGYNYVLDAQNECLQPGESVTVTMRYESANPVYDIRVMETDGTTHSFNGFDLSDYPDSIIITFQGTSDECSASIS